MLMMGLLDDLGSVRESEPYDLLAGVYVDLRR